MSSNRVEKHVLGALGALLRRDAETSLAASRDAAALAPRDPFVLFLVALIAGRCGAPADEQRSVYGSFEEHASAHPMFQASKSVLPRPG